MKDLKQHILEKLKVSKNSISEITIEALVEALQGFKDRNRLADVLLDLKEIFEEYPRVLHYNGPYTNTNIKGVKIEKLGYTHTFIDEEDEVFIYFDRRIDNSKSAIRIDNTDDLYDIFGDDALNKIYDYLITH